ncbi:unnamed protein product [Closterium sp. NIES-65]|nr:unnamed protein product [Closterium sp. NIES-65]
MGEAAMPEAGTAVDPAERGGDSAPFEVEATRRTGALTGGDCTSHSPCEAPSSPNAGASPPAALSLSPDSIREPARSEWENHFSEGNGLIGAAPSVGAPCAAVSPNVAPTDGAVPPTSSISPDSINEPVCSGANIGFERSSEFGGECATRNPDQPPADSPPPDSLDAPDSLPPVSAVLSPSAVPPTSTQPVPIDAPPHPKLMKHWREEKAEASHWWLLGERHVPCVSLTRGAKLEAYDPVDFHFPKGEARGNGEGGGRVGGKEGGKEGGRGRGRPPKWASKGKWSKTSGGSAIVRFGTTRGGEVSRSPSLPLLCWFSSLAPSLPLSVSPSHRLSLSSFLSLSPFFARVPGGIAAAGVGGGADTTAGGAEGEAARLRALRPAMPGHVLRHRAHRQVYVQQCCFEKLTRVKERVVEAVRVMVYVQQCCFQKLTLVKERAADALHVSTAAHITMLLRFLNLRPTRPAEFTPADFNRHTENLGFGSGCTDRQAASKRVRATVAGGESNEEGEGEARSMTDEEVNRYVGVTTNNQALPEMEPPPGVTSQLRCYQKQALHWMLSMEALGQTVPSNGQPVSGNAADGGDGGKRTRARDECDTLHPGGTPFYHNVFSGEVTLEFPSAMERSRGGVSGKKQRMVGGDFGNGGEGETGFEHWAYGSKRTILADAMGLGKTVMTIALIAASKANRERERAKGPGGKPGGVVGKMEGGGVVKQVRDGRRHGNINGACSVAIVAAFKEDVAAVGSAKRKRGECSAVVGAGRGIRVGSRRKKRVKREVEEGPGEGGDVAFFDYDYTDENEDEKEDEDGDEEYLPGGEGDDGGGRRDRADVGSSDSDGGGADSDDAEVQEVGASGRCAICPQSHAFFPKANCSDGVLAVMACYGSHLSGENTITPFRRSAECEAHTAPGVLSVMVYYGSQRQDEARLLAQHDVVITTYGTLQAEYKRYNKHTAEDSVASAAGAAGAAGAVPQGPLHSVQWCRAVLDEAHCIKNRASGAAAATFALQADSRWCLTGTPIQVSGEEGEVGGGGGEGEGVVSGEEGEVAGGGGKERGWFSASRIARLVLPLPPLRSKLIPAGASQARPSREGKRILVLPPISYRVISCDFSPEERDFYDALHNKSKVKFDNLVAQGKVLHNYASILACLPPSPSHSITRSRLSLRPNPLSLSHRPPPGQVCDHPFLVLSRSDTMDDEDLSKLGRRFLAASSLGAAGAAAGCAAAAADAAAAAAGAWGESSSDPNGWDESHKGPSWEYVQSVLEGLKRRREGLSQGGDECPVCLEAAEDAVFMPCAHIACRECLLTAWRPSVNGPCPVCRRQILRSQLITVPRASRFSLDVEASWQDSVKVRQLLQCLGEIRAASARQGSNGGGGGEKSVVFSQWTAFLDLLEIAFKRAKVPYVRLDGSMSQQQRERAINELKDNPKVEVLLVSLKAGGVGLNLTAASHAFVMDPWWNPSVEEQAVMRVHRIGQTRPVTVTRFIVRDSVEERMQKVQLRKDQMVQGALMDDGARSARINELKMLFR